MNREILPMMKQMVLLGCMCASFVLSAADGGKAAENLNRLPGTKLSADSVFYKYTADKAADGDRTDKLSRWVSSAESGEHWIMAEYDAPRKVNAVTLVFWTDTHVSLDFDIEGRVDGKWVTLREVRGNRAVAPRLVFPEREVSALRVVFRKQIPDSMVRLYEFSAECAPHALELSMSPTRGNGFLEEGEARSVTLYCHEKSPVRLNLRLGLKAEAGRPAAESVQENRTVELKGAQTFRLPVPKTFGAYEYEIVLTDEDGTTVLSQTEPFFYFPPSNPAYKTASPFAAHYYHMHPALIDYVGLYWWRNHDVYGRWNNNMDEQGNADWSELDERLAEVRANRIRECAVLLGAPRKYSTVLPGEPVSSGRDSIYSYYPPSDIGAWCRLYLEPLAGKVAKASPFRVYEIWNEAWSYYRLRGLHGTPGEAMQLFRESYEALKKADPEAMVYPTDTGAALKESPYAFREFGRDMFELGYLRWADLMSYHSYGMMDYGRLENYRANMWNYGRDFEMWSTETAASGQPFHRLMESLLSHRVWGNGKTFIYNGSLWAPLYSDGRPHKNLVAMAAMIRELGDALPLGFEENGDVTAYLFANGGTPVAVLFSKSAEPAEIDLPLSRNSVVRDVFGRELDAKQPVLSLDNPVFVRDPAPEAVVRLAAAQLDFLAKHARKNGEWARIAAERLRKAEKGGLIDAVRAEVKRISAFRGSLESDVLYDTNLVLDVLTNLEICLARREREEVSAPATVKELRRAVAGQWEAIRARTGDNGVLLDSERLTSRAQKEVQFAMQYDSDGDAVARDIWLNRAAADLANAGARTASEKMTELYKTKSYFRSHKILIRSELYCFPAGKPQEAVITLANPTGTPRRGTLSVELPEGWKADRTELAYEVPPLSRRLLRMELTAPASFRKEWRGKIVVTDRDGNFPAVQADCRIVEKVPPYPVLGGSISTGEFTGN